MPFLIQSDAQTLRNRQIALMQDVDTISDNTENVTMLFGINTWAFPELANSESLVMVANATPGVPVATGQTFNSTQIKQAQGLLNYNSNVATVLGNPQIVSFDTTLNWVVAPTTPGPWNSSLKTTGIILFQKKSLTSFDNTWFGEEYSALKQNRLNANYEPYISGNVIGGARAPIFTGQGGTNNIDKYSSGLYALAVCLEVTNTASYTQWRSEFLKNAAATPTVPFEILMDTDFNTNLLLSDGTVGNKMFGNWDKETRLMLFGTNDEADLQSFSNWFTTSANIVGATIFLAVELSAYV